MSEALRGFSNLSVQLFAIASMAAIGLRYSVADITGPLRNVWAVVLALVGNFVAVPLLAFGILHLIDLKRRTLSASFSWHRRQERPCSSNSRNSLAAMLHSARDCWCC